MKKLKIKNKRQFKKAILVIIMAFAIITMIILFGNYIKIEGIDSLFTTKAYKDAFNETKQSDIATINLLMGLSIGCVINSTFNILLEYESEEQEDYELNQILKRNGVNVQC